MTDPQFGLAVTGLAAAEYICRHYSVNIHRLVGYLLKRADVRRDLGLNRAPRPGSDDWRRAYNAVVATVKELEEEGLVKHLSYIGRVNWHADGCPTEACVRAARRLFAALDALRIHRAAATMRKMVATCAKSVDKRLFLEYTPVALAREFLYNTLVVVRELARKNLLRDLDLILAFHWMYLKAIAADCELAERVTLTTLKTAEEMGWPGARWPLVVPLIYFIHKRCGGVPVQIIQSLDDEWPQVESYLRKGAAETHIAGKRLRITFIQRRRYGGHSIDML